MKACTTIDICGAWLVAAFLWKHVMTLFSISAAVLCLSLFCAGSYCVVHAVAALVSQKAEVGAFCRD